MAFAFMPALSRRRSSEKLVRDQNDVGHTAKQERLVEMIENLKSKSLRDPYLMIQAEDEQDLQEAFKLRYDVFVDQYGEAQRYANHSKRIIEEPLDEYGIITNVYDDEGIIATARVNPWSMLPSRLMDPEHRIPEYLVKTGLRIPVVIDRRLISSGAKFCVAPRAKDFRIDFEGKDVSLANWFLLRLHEMIIAHDIELHIESCRDDLVTEHSSWGYQFLREKTRGSFDMRAGQGHQRNLMYMLLYDYEHNSKSDHLASRLPRSEEKEERARHYAKILKLSSARALNQSAGI